MKRKGLNPYKWRVSRDKHGWKVQDPIHSCDDNDRTWLCQTFSEAIVFAQHLALRERLRDEFSNALDNDQVCDEILEAFRQLAMYMKRYRALL